MTDDTAAELRGYLVVSRDALEACGRDPVFVATAGMIIDRVVTALTAGHKLLLAGNGGSAGDAQHIAGEFMSRLNYDRAPLAAIALTTDSSVLTAIGNDYGYEHVFERQVLGLGRPGDILIVISTSGRSPNILKAIVAAKAKRLVVIGLSGKNGGDMASACDLCLRVPSDSTPIIQQLHITVAHIICGIVEARLFPRESQPAKLAEPVGGLAPGSAH
jgi:D-sedoheptulose 7-phosphate isomerase